GSVPLGARPHQRHPLAPAHDRPIANPFVAYLLVRGAEDVCAPDGAPELQRACGGIPRRALARERGPLRGAAEPRATLATTWRRSRCASAAWSRSRCAATLIRLHASSTREPSLHRHLAQGVESLIGQPAIMSFYELTTEECLEIGIKNLLIRDAVGIEDANDLIAVSHAGPRPRLRRRPTAYFASVRCVFSNSFTCSVEYRKFFSAAAALLAASALSLLSWVLSSRAACSARWRSAVADAA